MAAPAVTLCCQELREALSVIMESVSSTARHAEALRFCLEFRDTSPLCLPCGLVLAKDTEAPVVRHFGLRLLAHVVEVRWDLLQLKEQALLKRRVLELIAGTTISDKTYIGDAVARLMVEVIKMDWPLLWPTMLSELKILSRRGASQAQVVLLTLLRLTEDVMNFEKLPVHFGNVLRSALRDSTQQVIKLVEASLRYYCKKYKGLVVRGCQAQSYCCVILAALNALTGYMEWVPTNHFIQNNYRMLKMLWHFLEDSKLQQEASECLLVFLVRRDSGKGNASLLAMFKDVPLQYLAPIKMTDGEELTEKQYFFMRAKCRLVCVLIEDFCNTMDFNGSVNISFNLGKYLDILLGFTMHPSLFLSFLTQSPWRHLFEQTHLSSYPFVQAMLPKYLRSMAMNLMMVGFPSMNNSPRCEYSRLEFGGDEDFSDFLTAFRHEQRIVIDAAFRLDHKVCYQIAFEYLKHQLSASVDPRPMNSVTADTLCHTSSQSFLQWEAATFYLKVTMENMLQSLNKDNMPVDDCIELLELVKNFKTEDPLILDCVQTNVSILNPFLNFRKECSLQILSKFLYMIVEIKAPKAQSVKGARRSKCSQFIEMCRDNAQNLLCGIGMLNKQVSQLLCSNTPMQMEKGTVMEAVVIIINTFKNFQEQKVLLEELMAPVASLWKSKDMQLAFSKTSELIKFVGPNICITDTVMEIHLDLNRSRIMDCVSSILGVLIWSRWPSDLEEAKSGGFVIGYKQSGRPIYRNPCTELVQTLLENMFLLIRTQYCLYMPQIKSKLCDSFIQALDPLEVENDSTLDLPQPLLDIFDPPEYKTAPERLKAFFCTLHKACFSVFGRAVSTMNEDFYTMIDHVNRLFDLVYDLQQMIPPHRLRHLVRAFLKPLVHSCPPEYYEGFLFPIMNRILNIFQTRLSDEWNIINQRNMMSKENTAVESTVVKNPMSEKALEIQVKLLTDEFVEFLFACCVPTADASVTAASNDVCWVSEDAEDTVCTPECEDNVCACNENDVVASASDGDCCVPIENNEASAVLAVDLDEGEMAAEVPLFVPQSAPQELSELPQFVARPAPPELSDMQQFMPRPAPPELSDLQQFVSRPAPTELSDLQQFVPRPALPELSDLPQFVPRPAPPELSDLGERTEPAELTTLGMCFLKEKDLRSSLLLAALSTLVWNDSVTCQKIATRLCWPLLKQVISEPLAAEHMISLLKVVLSAILKHKDDPFSRDALVNLAFHICERLRPHHEQFSHLIIMDPHTKGFYLERFDLIHFSEEFKHRVNMTKDDLQSLIEDCTIRPLGKTSQDNGMCTTGPRSLKRTNHPITHKELDHFPPAKK